MKVLEPKDFNKKYFSSGGYDEYETDVASWISIMARLIKRCLKNGKKRPRVLDAGCAHGYLIAELQNKYGADVAGLEYSDFAIQRADKTVRSKIKQGSILTAIFPRNSFDAVVCLDVFSYFAEKEVERAAKQLSGWTNKFIFFSSIYRHSRHASQKRNPDELRKTTLTQKEYIDMFRDAGVKFIGKRNIGNGGDILIFKKQ
ncbi:MAG: class I SAM-dependent methyltransferase [Candidatus Jorgensenbacteria bacterium]|nr:class I SAM-dependent methyltransferase [Candidatus Jorgensenbacteria bacterium]